jgi:two-component system OmpR family sensor kinase
MKGSLQRYLSISLSGIVALAAVLAGAFSFSTAFHEANEYQDGQLRQIAALVDQNALMPISTEAHDNSKHGVRKRAVAIQVLPRATQQAQDGARGMALPADLPDGFSSLRVNDEHWRFFVTSLHSGDRLAVGQRTAARDELARGSGWRTAAPLLILIPVLVLTITLITRHALRPVLHLARSIDARIHHDLRPLDDSSMPREILPFVRSINGLLGRVRTSMETQRRFVADAAHELRSPLAAMSVQMGNLSATPLPADAAARLQELRGGLRRTITLAEQLLTLARSQDADPLPVHRIDVKPVISRVVEDLLPLAIAKSIDLGVQVYDDATIAATPVDLMTLIRNLLDNAIRYTPEGGRVDLRVLASSTGLAIEIEDTGIGIPAADRSRVFDRFYRIMGSQQTGSGLGLSIVAAIVERWRGTITLSDAHTAPPVGLKVSIDLPSIQPEKEL